MFYIFSSVALFGIALLISNAFPIPEETRKNFEIHGYSWVFTLMNAFEISTPFDFILIIVSFIKG